MAMSQVCEMIALLNSFFVLRLLLDVVATTEKMCFGSKVISS